MQKKLPATSSAGSASRASESKAARRPDSSGPPAARGDHRNHCPRQDSERQLQASRACRHRRNGPPAELQQIKPCWAGACWSTGIVDADAMRSANARDVRRATAWTSRGIQQPHADREERHQKSHRARNPHDDAGGRLISERRHAGQWRDLCNRDRVADSRKVSRAAKSVFCTSARIR